MPSPTILLLVFLVFFLSVSAPLSCLSSRSTSSHPLCYIARSSINLRASPIDAKPSFEYDTLQNTQLLLGDRVEIYGKYDDWLDVRAMDQLRFSNGTWHGYDGFIRKEECWEMQKQDASGKEIVSHRKEQYDKPLFAIVQVKRAEIFEKPCFNPGCLAPSMEVSLGTIFRYVNVDPHTMPILGWIQVGTEDAAHKWYIKASDVNLVDKLMDQGEYPFVIASRQEEDTLRSHILEESFKLIGSVYFWGGRSSYSWKDFVAPVPGTPQCLSGVDCSGLVGLSYQALGLILPRDAHDMYLRAERFPLADGKPGDLFFFEKPASSRVIHVMMMVDSSYIVESTSAVNASRIVSIEDRFGAKYDNLSYGMKVDDYRLYWGRFIKSG